MAYTVYSFASSYNASNLNGLTPPATVADLVNSQWAGKIASSYPNDDDAVLYLYTRYVAGTGSPSWLTRVSPSTAAPTSRAS